jgi:hypothetical protein
MLSDRSIEIATTGRLEGSREKRHSFVGDQNRSARTIQFYMAFSWSSSKAHSLLLARLFSPGTLISSSTMMQKDTI